MRRFLGIVVVLVTAGCLQAAPLADRVPADAVAYVGWQGAKAAGPAYQQSRLKQLVEISDIGQTGEFVGRALAKVGRNEKSLAQFAQILTAEGQTLWDCPVAAYLSPLAKAGPGPRIMHSVLIVDAGAGAADMASRLETAAAKQWPDQGIVVKAVGNFVGIGDDDSFVAMLGGKAGAGGGAATLADSADFRSAMQKVAADAAITCYLNVDAVRSSIDQAAPPEWTKWRDALGLQGIHRAAYSAGFDGKQWRTQAFVAAPSPRQGIAALLDTQPLTDGFLKVVPANATLVMAGQFDLARLLTETRTALGKADPQALAQYNKALGAARLAMGVDIEKSLAASLGSEWVLYSAPNVGGPRAFGWVLANRLRDPAGADKALTTLENALCNAASSGLRQNKMQLRAYRVKQGALTVHYLGLMAVSPAWTIQDGTLYIAGYPQVALAAAESAAAGKGSILDNPTIAAARKAAPGPVSAIQFVDLPATCGDGYGTCLLLSRYALGLSDMLGVQAPPMFVPPLHKLQPLMEPSVGTSWADDQGWYTRNTEPFPGSILLADDFSVASGMMQPAMLAAIVIPQFTNASEDAKRSSVMSTQQSLRSQFELYRLQHADAYPDLETYPQWEQLLQHTSEEGLPEKAGRFGPYLVAKPTNAFNGYSGVEVVNGPIQAGYKATQPGIGWIFVKNPGRLYATDRQGVVILID